MNEFNEKEYKIANIILSDKGIKDELFDIKDMGIIKDNKKSMPDDLLPLRYHYEHDNGEWGITTNIALFHKKIAAMKFPFPVTNNEILQAIRIIIKTCLNNSDLTKNAIKKSKDSDVVVIEEILNMTHCFCGKNNNILKCCFISELYGKNEADIKKETNILFDKIEINKNKSCLYPNCKNFRINSHSCSQGNILSNMMPNGIGLFYTNNNAFSKSKGLAIKKIGKKKATAKHLFCHEHDQNIFKILDECENKPNKENSLFGLLTNYRAATHNYSYFNEMRYLWADPYYVKNFIERTYDKNQNNIEQHIEQSLKKVRRKIEYLYDMEQISLKVKTECEKAFKYENKSTSYKGNKKNPFFKHILIGINTEQFPIVGCAVFVQKIIINEETFIIPIIMNPIRVKGNFFNVGHNNHIYGYIFSFIKSKSLGFTEKESIQYLKELNRIQDTIIKSGINGVLTISFTAMRNLVCNEKWYNGLNEEGKKIISELSHYNQDHLDNFELNFIQKYEEKIKTQNWNLSTKEIFLLEE